jgi:hypothetical protein
MAMGRAAKDSKRRAMEMEEDEDGPRMFGFSEGTLDQPGQAFDLLRTYGRTAGRTSQGRARGETPGYGRIGNLLMQEAARRKKKGPL